MVDLNHYVFSAVGVFIILLFNLKQCQIYLTTNTFNECVSMYAL